MPFGGFCAAVLGAIDFGAVFCSAPFALPAGGLTAGFEGTLAIVFTGFDFGATRAAFGAGLAFFAAGTGLEVTAFFGAGFFAFGAGFAGFALAI
ncbi:MAG: hypothetical protein WCF18_25470 [Chthoniobacteraceae bacterium]